MPVSLRARGFHAQRIGQMLLHVLGQVRYLLGELSQRLPGLDRGLGSLSGGDAGAVELGMQLRRNAFPDNFKDFLLGVRQIIPRCDSGKLFERAVV
jgi:hypothetical protein